MTTTLPTVFIGSSTEGLPIAEKVKAKLKEVANVRLWNERVFRLGHSLLEGLIAALDQFDFAVMIITPDDLLNKKNELNQKSESYNSPRDNVLFELGLFMGRIGRERTFILNENSPSLRMPSDLEGIIRANYSMDEQKPDVESACISIGNAIQELGRRTDRDGQNVQTFDEVNAAFNILKNNIQTRKLQLTHAELIQHSSERAAPLVSALADIQTDIQLYLQHPETLDTVCSELRPRVTSRLSFYPHELKRQNYEGKLQIYLYQTPASFDGIRLWKADGTKLLVMGWYIYLSDKPLKDLTKTQFKGSENPCFMIDNSHPDYRHFNNFFDQLISSCTTQGTPPVFQMKNGTYEWLSGWP